MKNYNLSTENNFSRTTVIVYKTVIVFITFSLLLVCCQKEINWTEKYFDVRKMKVYFVEKGQRLLDFWTDYDKYYEYNEFYIVLDFRDSIYYYSQNQNWSFNLINPVYATHVTHGFDTHNNDGYLGSQEMISSIYISSDADFDSLHLAGDTLNDYFDVKYVLDSVENRAQKYLLFSLIKEPEFDSIQTFNIKYYQTNGEYYSGKITVKIK